MSVFYKSGPTVPGIGPGSWDSGKLAREQKSHVKAVSVLYRLYTEHNNNIRQIVSEHFDGATIIESIGLWQGALESGVVVEIIGTSADKARILELAADIRVSNKQVCVLVTEQAVSITEVTA